MQKVLVLGLCLLAVWLMAACNLRGAPPATEMPTNTQAPTAETTQPAPASSSTPEPSVTPTRIPDEASPTLMITQQSGGASPTQVNSANAVIIAPVVDTVVSGTPLEINGVVNNLAEDRFMLELRDATGNVINRQEITLRNPNRIPQISWSASLFTRYTGPASIFVVARDRRGREFIAASVRITIGQ
jgi:hypothetical protein